VTPSRQERRRPAQDAIIALIEQAIDELDQVRGMLLETAGLLIAARNRWAGLDLRSDEDRHKEHLEGDSDE
jgi:hypothetical protein